MRIDVAACSERGPRPRNEDAAGAWVITETYAGIVVADGLGGHVGGQRASNFALNEFRQYLLQESHTDLEFLAEKIHAQIRRLQLDDTAYQSMATTFSAVVVDGEDLQAVHCGDTRIVLQRGQGIKRLTDDHTEAQRFLSEGLLTREEYESYPRKHVLESALGILGRPRIDKLRMKIGEGDRIFITSDGLHGKVLLRELKSISDCSRSAEECVSTLMQSALDRELDDNVSVAALFLHT